MKRNLFAFGAMTLAIAVSSFTVSKVDTTLYMVYDGLSTQTVVGSYSQTATMPSQDNGTGILHWFRIVDQNNGVIDQSEFTTRFSVLDTDNDGTLNDQANITGQLDKLIAD